MESIPHCLQGSALCYEIIYYENRLKLLVKSRCIIRLWVLFKIFKTRTDKEYLQFLNTVRIKLRYGKNKFNIEKEYSKVHFNWTFRNKKIWGRKLRKNFYLFKNSGMTEVKIESENMSRIKLTPENFEATAVL